MRHALAIVFLTATLIVDPPVAGAFRTIGEGGSSCGTWTAERHSTSRGRFGVESWILGFLSGIGYVGDNGDDPLKGMDADGVQAWIDNYCQNHPIDHIMDAARAFYLVHPH